MNNLPVLIFGITCFGVMVSLCALFWRIYRDLKKDKSAAEAKAASLEKKLREYEYAVPCHGGYIKWVPQRGDFDTVPYCGTCGAPMYLSIKHSDSESFFYCPRDTGSIPQGTFDKGLADARLNLKLKKDD